ncbi:hypothetical protein TEA_004275 [Camellia sinensis var. sinensis]|uniref:Protein kinase domain-containing protein n=1 Tax=Camellia sinensis var. sinensis TaxID=542762 RepID=A0A4S4D2X3_CAMSN|nr:hypothetical protein TEA_004275 [Camellia sinensis var. sinensis]
MLLKLTNLTTLYLGGNQFSGSILGSIANASRLVRVDFSNNNFTGHIPSMGNLPSIQVLNLEINELVSGGERGMDFITSLANSTQLQVFSMATNRLTGRLPLSIGNLSRQLSLLVMGENHLEGNLPGEISNLVGLTMLSVEYNSFTGIIPPSIGTLPNLQNLYFHRNQFSGKIPESFRNLTELYEMGLKSNLLTGTIPPSLENYQHLQILDLSVNMLSGTIPREIFSIPSFGKLLNLSWNRLNGSLPEEIGNLKMIQAIDVSNNPLTGDILVSIGDCSSLLYLNLSRNSFQGPIPKSLSELNGIEYIDLAKNNLTGEILASLERLQFLQLLDLSENQLQGNIPTGRIFNNATAVSLDGNPQLCGGLLNEIKIATRNFSQENLIGEGSFGTVYKGTFSNGTVAAIKVFKMEQHKAFKSFLAECEALRNIRHRNLIRVISVCSNSDFKALVLHFMPNGSLEQWLHERNKRLCIKERLEIVQDVASAIEYLHHDCESPVMHCDLKPSSVFLNESMCAHVADFRLAQILVNAANKGSVSSTLGLKGSIGYIPPEYGIGEGVSTKGDVYSFGILMLEIFTKKKPTDEMFTGEMDL